MTEPVNNLTLKLSALTTTLGGKLDTIAADIAALRLDVAALQGDAPSNTLQSINQSLWNIAGPAPGTTLTDLLAAISANAGSDSSAAISAILAAIGSLSSDPANYTVKELLGLLQTSMDSSPTEKVGPNVPPSSTECGNWVRVTGFTYAGWASGYSAYTPLFDTQTINGFMLDYCHNADSSRRYYRATLGTQARVCFGWNVSGHRHPSFIKIINANLIGMVEDNWFYPLSQLSIVDTYPAEGGPLPDVGATSYLTETLNFPSWTGTNAGIADTAVEFLILFADVDSTIAPTDLDFFVSARG